MCLIKYLFTASPADYYREDMPCAILNIQAEPCWKAAPNAPTPVPEANPQDK